MNKNIIGRKQEISRLQELYKSNKPEFVAVFGRRRVRCRRRKKNVIQNPG